MPKINFPNKGLSQQVPSGCDFQRIHTLYPDLPLRFGCRRGECGVCVFYVLKGKENLTKLTPEEIKTIAQKKFPPECRLGCQCAVNGNVSLATWPLT